MVEPGERIVRGMYGREACVTVQGDPDCYDRERQTALVTEILLADLLRFQPPLEATEGDFTFASAGSQTSAFYPQPEDYKGTPPDDYVTLQHGLLSELIDHLPDW